MERSLHANTRTLLQLLQLLQLLLLLRVELRELFVDLGIKRLLVRRKLLNKLMHVVMLLFLAWLLQLLVSKVEPLWLSWLLLVV